MNLCEKSKFSKKTQVSVEYMIVIGFVTFAVLSILVISYLYSGLIRDRIRANQVENFATQLVNSAESVFFAGEPTESTISLSLPSGVKSITIEQYNVIIVFDTSTGENKRAFAGRVPMQGTISNSEGIKKISIKAREDFVDIIQS